MGTKNNFTTLVSVRLENDIVESLEKFVKRSPYHTRSSTINNLLKAVMKHADDGDIEFMINTRLWTRTKWNLKIEHS